MQDQRGDQALRFPSGFSPLSDRTAAIHRALCLALILFSLVGLTLGTWRDQQQQSKTIVAFYGLGVRLDSLDGRMMLTEIGDPRANAVVAKSELLAIDGASLPPFVGTVNRTRISERLTKPDGESVRLTVRDPDGRVTEHRFVRSPAYIVQTDRTAPMTFANRMRLNYVSTLLPGILYLVAGLLLLRGRRRDPVVALLSIGLLGEPAMRAALAPMRSYDKACAARKLWLRTGVSRVLMAGTPMRWAVAAITGRLV